MAVGRDRLAALDEVADHGNSAGLVAQVFGRAPAGENQPVIRRGIDVVEPEVGLDSISRLLGVGIEAGFEVVHDREEDTLLGRDDVDLPPLLFEPELGVIDLLSLARVARQQQYLEHGLPALAFTLDIRGSPSPHRLPGPLPQVATDGHVFHGKHSRIAAVGASSRLTDPLDRGPVTMTSHKGRQSGHGPVV